MKRILFFNDSLSLGGTEVLLVDLLNHLSGKDCRITLLLPQPSDSDVLLKEVSDAVEVKYLYKKNASHLGKRLGEFFMVFFPRLFALCKGIKSSDYDEVVCFKECFYARIFSKMKLYKILWIHNILYRRQFETHSAKERLAVWLNKKQLRITQRAYNKFDKVVCVSDTCKQVYLNILHNGEEPKNQSIEVLYNAIDLDKVIEKSKEPIPDLPQGITKFLLVTRVSPEKRTDRLIYAASRLKEEGYKFMVYIIGEGLEQTAKMPVVLGNDTIHFMGRIDNPFPYMLQCNWLLCVSERESFSLALLEAMALKTPVITTDCGGPADIVAGGKYGILVPNSAEGVYEGMKKVLDTPALSVEYSANLKEAVARFDYNSWLRKVDKLLNI